MLGVPNGGKLFFSDVLLQKLSGTAVTCVWLRENFIHVQIDNRKLFALTLKH